MKVLYDALLLDGPRSGVEVAVAEAGRALVEQAPDSLVFAVRCGVARQEAWLGGAEVRQAPVWAVGRAGRILAEQLWLPRAGRDCDLLHGPAYVLPLGWRGPAVVTIYDLVALIHPQWTRGANAAHFRYVLPRSVRRAARIVVPSRVVAAEVLELLGMEEHKVEVAPLGVREVFRQRPAEGEVGEFCERHGLERPFFAVVGNLEPKKNVAGIVRAFELAASRIPHDLVFAGRKRWRAQPDVAVMRTSPVRDRIRLLGPLSDTELRALYHACTALIQWSLYEGFGLVPLEAMSCRTAVIVSDGGALPEIAGPGARVVPLGDPSALAEAMVLLAGEPAIRKELAAIGHNWAERFTWKSHAEALLRIYADALAD